MTVHNTKTVEVLFLYLQFERSTHLHLCRLHSLQAKLYGDMAGYYQSKYHFSDMQSPFPLLELMLLSFFRLCSEEDFPHQHSYLHL